VSLLPRTTLHSDSEHQCSLTNQIFQCLAPYWLSMSLFMISNGGRRSSKWTRRRLVSHLSHSNCSWQCRSQEQSHMPKGVLWVIFNLRKNIGLIICITNYTCYILWLSFLISNRINLYIVQYLSDPVSSAPQWMSPSLPFSHTRLILICPPRDLGLTWLGCPLLGLPRSCCRSKSQTQALKNHTDTHHNWDNTPAQQLQYIQQYIFTLFHIFRGELRRAWCAQITVEHTNGEWRNPQMLVWQNNCIGPGWLMFSGSLLSLVIFAAMLECTRCVQNQTAKCE
jgi:hypothetical protein